MDRNQQAMLDKVRAIWITGFLEQSLEKEARVALDLKEDTKAVTRSLDLLGQLSEQPDRRLPPDQKIIDVYDEQDRHLLILGNPGAGKTTLLLELTRDLLDRAGQKLDHPIPVVFPLSSWADKRLPLADWLVDELNQRNDVPSKVGQAWVDADQILPLLDGLDEVAHEHRAQCVEAINRFRQDRGLLPLAVCSRSEDYAAIGKKLHLQGAVVVQPLTEEQVDTYLMQVGDRLDALRRVLREDATLRELLDNPLMLNVMTLAYEGQQDVVIQTGRTLKERRRHLFETYVERMFARRKVRTPYTQSQTLHWLAWLARQMVQQSQTMFYIEGLQPDWLPQEQQGRFRLGTRLVYGVIGGLVYGVIYGLVFGLVFGVIGGLAVGLDSGGKACIQHFTLRFLLVRNGFAPWNYPAFLDSAAERLFLRKVGGGYVFIHRMLLEYFAGLDTSLEGE